MSKKPKKPATTPAAAPPAPPATILAPDGTPAREKPEVIHIKKAWNGRLSVEEAHALGIGKKCACGNYGAGWIRTFIEIKEFIAREPIRAALIAREGGGQIPTVKTKYGELFKVGEITPCSLHWSDGERQAAKHPDWVFVEIRRGPRSTIMASVPERIGPTFSPPPGATQH